MITARGGEKNWTGDSVVPGRNVRPILPNVLRQFGKCILLKLKWEGQNAQAKISYNIIPN